MKAKVVIENGETNIVLTPENKFETDVLDNVYRKSKAFDLKTHVNAQYNYGVYDKHRIEICIKEKIAEGKSFK